MAVWSAVLEKDGQAHTFLGRVFDALENQQVHYNFLLVGIEAYPVAPEFQFVNRDPVWISGEELTHMIGQEDFQWVWGALLAFLPSVSREQAVSRVCDLYAPSSSDQDSWHVRNRFPETGAEFMIFAEDSTYTELLARRRELVERFCRHEPRAKMDRITDV